MRHRRHRLQVSTFPFLAVLLCTMGSLILVLLVIDRQGKAGARAKAILEARKLAEEDAQTVAARRAEFERRQLDLHHRLEREADDLAKQAGELHHQSDDTDAAIRAAAAKFEELHRRIRSEHDKLKENAQFLGSKKASQEEKSKESEAMQVRLRRLAADLNTLERALADLRTARERQKNSYSVIPYKGKYGDDRHPIYVECSGHGLLFHPDRSTLEGYELSSVDIREAFEQRLARHHLVQAKADSHDGRPYVLMLLRPSGVRNYYRTLGAMVGLGVDFGYELVDEDWTFEFPDDREPPTQPWMSASVSHAVDLPEGQRSPAPSAPAPDGVFGKQGIGVAGGSGRGGLWGGPNGLADGVPLVRHGMITGGDGPAFDPYHPPGYFGGLRGPGFGAGGGGPGFFSVGNGGTNPGMMAQASAGATGGVGFAPGGSGGGPGGPGGVSGSGGPGGTGGGPGTGIGGPNRVPGGVVGGGSVADNGRGGSGPGDGRGLPGGSGPGQGTGNVPGGVGFGPIGSGGQGPGTGPGGTGFGPSGPYAGPGVGPGGVPGSGPGGSGTGNGPGGTGFSPSGPYAGGQGVGTGATGPGDGQPGGPGGVGGTGNGPGGTGFSPSGPYAGGQGVGTGATGPGDGQPGGGPGGVPGSPNGAGARQRRLGDRRSHERRHDRVPRHSQRSERREWRKWFGQWLPWQR